MSVPAHIVHHAAGPIVRMDCSRCGRWLRIAVPMSDAEIARRIGEFEREHADCTGPKGERSESCAR